jgi:hypothetical protein
MGLVITICGIAVTCYAAIAIAIMGLSMAGMFKDK